MKRIKIILVTFITTLLLIPINANAASGSISVSAASTAVKGNSVTVTVKLSSGTSIGSWQMDLNYDKSYLQLVSSNAEGGGTRMVNSSASGTKSKSYTFTFKTLKTGNTRVSVSSYLAYAYEDMSEIDLSSSSKTIKIITQEELQASYSKDNNLKSLSVEGYELDKEFNKDTLEYTVNVPTGTTSVKINAQKNDSKASVSGAGEVTVTEGANTIPITVTAQNGSEKTYTLIINVEDQNPIHVTLNNKDYVIVKNKSLLEAPDNFTETTITIDGVEVPAFNNTIANITIVGLKDTSGTIIYAMYENGKYSKYNIMNLSAYTLMPTTLTEELDLTKTTITIDGEEIDAYKYNESDSLVIISAKNIKDGKASMYLYDTKSKSVIPFDNSLIKITEEQDEKIKNYDYVIITLGGALILMLIIIICLIISLRKKQKKVDKFLKKQEAKIEATRKLNDVIDEVKKITESEKEQDKPEETIEEKEVTQETPKKKKKKDKKKDEVKVEVINPNELPQEEPKQRVVEEPTIEEKNIKQSDEDEVYDLFADDKKKKKKKR